MSVSLDIWRQRVGCFNLCQRAQKLQWRTPTLKPPHVTGYGLRLALLLITLLVVAGDVESNPGPNQSREYGHKTESFNTQEVLDILQNPDWDRVIREPPVKPRAGQVFLYHITEDAKKDDWRCDQYHFHHDGTRKQPKKSPKFSKLFFLLKTSQGKDNRFKKHAYILLEGNTNLVLFQYLGDEGVAEDLPHGNSKNPKSVYTRLCPSLIRSIKNISLKPSDALRQLNKNAEASSVPELYRPRSIIHVINTKCRKPKKQKEPRDSKQAINSRNEKSTVDTTSVPERSTRKRSSSKETGYEPETKRTPRDDGDRNREESASSTLQTVCPGTLQSVCPNLSDVGDLGPAGREDINSEYQITGSVQQSVKPNTAIDHLNIIDNESTVGLAQTPSAGESKGISIMISSESTTSLDAEIDVSANHVHQNHSSKMETLNQNQSSLGSNTYPNQTSEPSSISTDQNSRCKDQSQQISSSSSFTTCISSIESSPCNDLHESEVNPVAIPSLQQEPICIITDLDRNGTNPTMVQICNPYLQELNINDDQLAEIIELLLDIVKTWNNQQQGITGAIDLSSTSSVPFCSQNPTSDVQSAACAPRVASILPQTAASLITQCGELWMAEFIRVRKVLTQTEVVKVALQSEIQPKDSLLTLLTTVLLGAQKTKSDVIRFLDTLNELPAHLQTTDDRCSGVQIDTDYKIGTYTIRGRDIDRLSGTAWMDDSVIHAYLLLLKDQFSEDNIFVLECFLANLWEKGNYSEWLYEQYILKNYSWILMPVCRNHHWLLMAANVRDRTVCVINSKPSSSTQTEMFLHWRYYMNRRSKVTGEDLSDWSEESFPVFPQTDGSSCGIYVLMAAEALLSGVSPGIMRNCHVTGYRKYVRQRLLASAVPVHGPENQDCEMDDVQVMTVEGMTVHQKERNTERINKQHKLGDKKTGGDKRATTTGDVYLMDPLDVSDIRKLKSGQAQHTLSGGQSKDKSKDVPMKRVDNSQNMKEEYCHISEETASTQTDSEDGEMVHAAATTQSCMVLTSDVCNFINTNNTQECRTAVQPEAKEFIEHLFLNEKGSFTALTLLCLLNGNLKLSELEILSDERRNPLLHYLKWSCELSGSQGMGRVDIKRELINLDRFVDITEDNIAMLRDPDVHRLTYDVLSNHAVDYISNIDLKFIYHYFKLQKRNSSSYIVFTKNNAHLLAARLAKEIIQGNIALTVSHDACEYYYFDILLRKALLTEIENDRSDEIFQPLDISFGGSFIHWLCFSKNAELFKCLSGMLTEEQKLDCVIPCCLSGNVDILQIICTEFNTTKIRDISQCCRNLPVISTDGSICDSPVEIIDTHSLPPLHLACFLGKCDIISWLLESGLDVNEQLNDGCPECKQIPIESTPASIAAARGHTDVMRCLIENKPDLNLHDTNFDTPLHIACREGHSDIVSLIVQHCNLSERNIHGDTPLHIACQIDGIENVMTLMRSESDYNLLNYENYTPLDIACEKGYTDIVEYMVDTYGYPLPCNGSNTPLHKACRGGFTDVVQLLLKHDAGRSVTLDNTHPLHVAVCHDNSRTVHLMLEHSSDNVLIQQDGTLLLNSIKSGSSEIVKKLLEKGADVSVTDDNGDAPLSAACKRGHAEIVKLLLEKGADVSVTDDNGDDPLIAACKGGHEEIVKLLLEKGADVSFTDEYGDTTLSAAYIGEDEDKVKLLLEKCADVSVTDDNCDTPLIAACKGGHEGIVKLLLEKGADVSVTNRYGHAPLISACEGGHEELVNLLLEKGADVSVTDTYGHAPLIAACKGGHEGIVKLLLEKGADVSVTDRYGDTPQIAACKGGHEGIVKLLLEKGVNVTVTDEHGGASLIAACEGGHAEILKLLLEKSANVSVSDGYGYNSLKAACQGGHEEIVKLLLEKGADVSVTDDNCDAPLITACEGGHEEIVKLLLEKGADVSVTDEDDDAPLIAACKGGHEGIVKLLLENGADVSVTYEDDDAPLIAACKGGHEEIVKLLIEKGADVSVTDDNCDTPLIAACKEGHEEIVKLLLEKGADVSVTDEDDDTPLIAACKGGHEGIVKLLLEKGADVSVTNRYGHAPLISACERGHEELVNLLLEKGADVSVTDTYGHAPLIAACKGGHEGIVKLLLENGADVSVTDRYGDAPLITACKGGHEELVKVLLEKGADVSVTDRYGDTPLIAACEEGHAQIVKLLLEKGADVSFTDEYGDATLSEACKKGHAEIVKLLLEKGADVSDTDDNSDATVSTACEGGHEGILMLLLEKGYNMSVSDDKGDTPLSAACKGGHEETVKLLLENGADVSVTDDNGDTPLISACKGGHEEIVKLLLEKGADVSFPDRCGDTLLSVACYRGQEYLVKLLLEKGADVSVTDRYGNSPLIVACKRGHEEIIKLLLEKGADVSVTNIFGDTPLIAACEGGHEEIVKLLLELGADVSVTDKLGYAPLIAACKGGHEGIVKLLIEKGADVSVTDGNGDAPLAAACEGGHEEIVKLLLELGADVSVTDRYGGTPLIAACKGGLEEIVKLLLEKGADVSVTSVFRDTPLSVACEEGHAEIVRQLFAKRADLSVTDNIGNAALFAACEGGHEEIVDLLLENVVDVSVNNYIGDDPLIAACEGGHEMIVKLLLEKGADVSVTDDNGDTPLSAACKGGHEGIVKQLLEKGADVSVTDKYGETSLIAACKGGHEELVKLLLEKGADVSVTDKYGETSLIAACKGGHEELVKLLSEKGADVLVTDRYGGTPLSAACKGGHEGIVKQLLEKGADVSVTDKYGETSLIAACKGGHEELVKLLLEKGADVSVTDRYGDTPQSSACKRGHEGIVNLLLEKGADVSVTDRYGDAPLIAACKGGHEGIVKLLLEKDADVSVTDRFGDAPLIAACKGGHEGIVKLLLEKGADVSVTVDNGDAPLSAACEGGHAEIVKLLLEKGADVSVTDEDGDAPLIAACKGGHEDIVKLLLENGADVSVTNEDGDAPLIAACGGGLEYIVKLLLEKGADVSVTGEDGDTPLSAACKGGHEKIVKLLLEKGADVSVTDRYGDTPLIAACKGGHEEIVKLLLEKGADVSVTDEDGYYPLNAAGKRGHEELLKLLLEKGADGTVTDVDGIIFSEIRAVKSKNSFFLLLAKSCNLQFARSSVREGIMYMPSLSTETGGGGYDIVHKFCDNCIIDMTSIVLEREPTAVFTSVGKDGRSILETVVHYGHLSVLCNIVNRLLTIPLSTEHTHCLLKSVVDIGDGHLLRLLIDHYIIYKQIELTCDEILIMSVSKCKYYICQMLIDVCKCAEIETVILEAYHQRSPFILNKLTGSRKINLTFKDCHTKTVGLNRKCLDIMVDGFLFECSTHFPHELLHSACVLGHQTVVKHILHKQNVNSDEITNMFHQVCKYGYTSIVQDLINAGADINAISEEEIHPLHIVCQRGHNDIAAMLIKTVSDIDKKDKHGRTALYLACSNMHHEIVKLLVTNGAQVTFPDCPSPLHLVCKIHNEQMIDKKGRISLHTAFERDNIDLIKLLLQHITCVFRRDNKMEMPVSILCKKPSLFKLVCENIPQYCLSDADDDGNTLLHHACLSGFHDCVLSLLHRTGNKSLVNKHKETALHTAVEKGHQKSVGVLLQFGYDCNSINDDDHTPLHIASADGCFEIVKLLIESKPNVNAKDVSSKTPLHHAAKGGHSDVVQILISHGSDKHSSDLNGDKPLHFACDSGDLDTVHTLVHNECDINSSGHKGRTPLHRAVARGSIKIVEYLLTRGAESHQNRFNNTPLHTACVEGHLDIMKLLLKYNDMLQISGLNGYFYVVICCIRGHMDILKYLINNGAAISPKGISWISTPLSVSLSDIYMEEESNLEYLEKSAGTGLEGRTPLDVALDENRFDIAEYLLTEGVARDIEICESDNRKNILVKICKKGNLQLARRFLFSDIIPASELIHMIEAINDGDSAKSISNSNTNKDCVKQIGPDVFEVIDEEEPTDETDSPILISCKADNFSIASLLIAYASGQLNDMNVSHIYEIQSPLHLAYDLGLMKVVSCLLFGNIETDVTDSDGYNIFHKACKDGHLSIIETMFKIREESTITIKKRWYAMTKSGEMMLHIAVSYGHMDIFKLFLHNNTDMTCVTSEGNNAMHIACSRDMHEICNILFDKIPNLAVACNDKGFTPFDKAFRSGSLGCLRVFMSCQNADFKTIIQAMVWRYLHDILHTNDFKLLTLLQKCVPLKEFIDKYGNTAFHICARIGNRVVMEHFAKKVKKSPFTGLVNTYGDTPLHIAVWHGHLDTVRVLIPISDRNVSNNHGDIPLHFAAFNSHTDIVQLLLASGANDTAKNIYGDTPLHVAACAGIDISPDDARYVYEIPVQRTIQTVKTLLRHDAGTCVHDVKMKKAVTSGKSSTILDKLSILNNAGKTPLHLACEYGHEPVAEVILELTGSRRSESGLPTSCINIQTPECGITPLYVACHRNRIHTVSLLLEQGADTSLKDKDGNMPVFVACEAGHVDVLKLLLPHTNLRSDLDNSGGTLLHSVCRCGHGELLNLIMDHVQNADQRQTTENRSDLTPGDKQSLLNKANNERQTALHVSCKYGNAECVNELLNHGAILNTSDINGRTPLHYASKGGCKIAVSLLLQRDICVSPVDTFGMTPLHYASLTGSVEIADQLLEAGADHFITDRNGSTPLDMCDQDLRHILTERHRYERKRSMSCPLVPAALPKKSRPAEEN